MFSSMAFVSADDSLGLPEGIKLEDLKSVPLFASKRYPHKTVRSPVTGMKRTVRAPGRYNQGVFFLCEGENPLARILQTYNRRRHYVMNYTPGRCHFKEIYGSLKYGARYLNHAKLWDYGEFHGLDYIEETAYYCDGTGYVGVFQVDNGIQRLVAKCNNAYEAHTYTWII